MRIGFIRPRCAAIPAAWGRLLWWLSLVALIGASAGAVIGMLRLGAEGSRFSSPYRGWQEWHHWLGLCCMLFVLTWIFSGWLSMDGGHCFRPASRPARKPPPSPALPDWNSLPPDEVRRTRSANDRSQNGSRSMAGYIGGSAPRSAYSGLPSPVRTPPRTPERAVLGAAEVRRQSQAASRRACAPALSSIAATTLRARAGHAGRAGLSLWSAAATGFTSMARAARCWKNSMRRAAPIAGSSAALHTARLSGLGGAPGLAHGFDRRLMRTAVLYSV